MQLSNTLLLASGLSLAALAACAQAQDKPADKSGAAKTVARPAGKINRLAPTTVTAAAKTGTGKATAKTEAPLASIVVRANVEVNNKTFTLGEIADIEGADKALIAQLATVEIGASPLPTLSRVITSGDVVVHLRAAHFRALLDSRRIELVSPDDIRIARTGHEVAQDEITKAAIASAQLAIKDIPNATLEPGENAGKVILPSGKVRIVPGAYRGKPETGALIVPVSLFVDGKPAQTVDIALKIHRRVMVVIAKRTLEPHDLITAGDVQLALAELPAEFAKPALETQAVLGKRATRRILADQPVSTEWLETPPDIFANAKVTIDFVYGTIHITAPGMTRQAGMIGETIRVYATDTHRELEAVVVDEHTVRLAEQSE